MVRINMLRVKITAGRRGGSYLTSSRVLIYNVYTFYVDESYCFRGFRIIKCL